jgi:hypothetical protein
MSDIRRAVFSEQLEERMGRRRLVTAVFITLRFDPKFFEQEILPLFLDVPLSHASAIVRHRTGIFHPNNVFVLVEDSEPVEDGHRQQALIVASMSAKLTRPGRQENVQLFHSEEIAEADSTRLREDLIRFFEGLERRVGDKH